MKGLKINSTLVKIQVVVAIVAVAVTIAVVLEIGDLFKKRANLEKEITQKKMELGEKKRK